MHRVQGFLAGARGDDFQVFMRQQLDHALALHFIVINQQKPFHTAIHKSLHPVKSGFQDIGGERLV